MAALESRYARALADVVFEQQISPASAIAELQSLVAMVRESADLRRIWESPAVPSQQKRDILDSLSSRTGICRTIRNFVAVLIDHRRVRNLAQIAAQFEVEIGQRLGFADVEVSSARELSADEREAIEQQVEQLAGKKVRARYSTDRGLLGGAVVRLGSTIYDGSVRGQLIKIKEQLSAT